MRKPSCVVPSRAVCAVFCPLALGLLCGGGVPLADLEDVRDVLRASQAGASPATNAVWLDAGVFPWPARGPLAALAAEAYPFPDPARIHLFASEDAATRNVVVADAAGAPRLRDLRLRTLLLELERIANHVGDLGALAGDVAFLPTASFCGRIRGEYLNMTALICGNRFGRNAVRSASLSF